MERKCRERWRGSYLSLGFNGDPVNDLAIGLYTGLENIETCSLADEVLSCFNSISTLTASFGVGVDA